MNQLTNKQRLNRLVEELKALVMGREVLPVPNLGGEIPAKDYLFLRGVLYTHEFNELTTITQNTLLCSTIKGNTLLYKNIKEDISSFIEK